MFIQNINSRTIVAFVIAALAITPILVICSAILQPETDVWSHLLTTTLPSLTKNTLLLCIGVSIGTGILGVSLGWLTGVCDFPGRRFFSIALLLPMAVPAYVFAFVFLGLMDFSSPFQGLLRSWFAIKPFDVRSVWTVCFVLTLALYPYVYVMAKAGFRTQGERCLEAARSLGCSPLSAFFRVALPLCRPWIATGILLVLMETLADFGAVSVFNFDTFTTAVYKAWYGFFSLQAAAQLASILVVLAVLLLSGEQHLRKKMRYTQEGSHAVRIPLHGAKAKLASLLCSTVFVLGFVAPTLQLVIWCAETFHTEFSSRYWDYSSSTLLLGMGAALITTGGALILAYVRRASNTPLTHWIINLSTMGYALPGTVLAVGIFAPVAFADNSYIALVRWISGATVSPIFQGTIVILLTAYMIRFMAAAYGTVNSNMQRITPSVDDASSLMGVTGWNMLLRVHLPQLRTGIFTAIILVLIDVMKEMPITLMTRPFGWDTLAVKIYELTSEGEWERAALPALILVGVGLIPVFLINKKAEQ